MEEYGTKPRPLIIDGWTREKKTVNANYSELHISIGSILCLRPEYHKEGCISGMRSKPEDRLANDSLQATRDRNM